MHAIEYSALASAQEILEALVCTSAGCICFKSAKRGHGLTHCPVHEDRTPSFNVSVKDNTVLVHCESGGCSQEDLIHELTARNLWPKHEQPITVPQTIVATYDYKDIHGNLVYQAIRMGPQKTFRQRRPDGKGGWVWNLDGVKRILYRLPELLAADPKRLRIIVEGEKDVDSLVRLGFIATSNVGGAGKWHPDYAEWFRNCNVCVIRDNDKAGRDHMVQVAQNVVSVARSVRWLELPGLKPKEDVTDWINAGGDADQLKELIKQAPLYTDDVITQKPVLANVDYERLLLYICAYNAAAFEFLEPDDFTDDVARAIFRAIRSGEAIDQDALSEPPEDFDEWAAICTLRDLTRRRAALKIAEHVISVASDTGRIFNPCLAADGLKALCEHSHDNPDSTRLTDVLNLL